MYRAKLAPQAAVSAGAGGGIRAAPSREPLPVRVPLARRTAGIRPRRGASPPETPTRPDPIRLKGAHAGPYDSCTSSRAPRQFANRAPDKNHPSRIR